MIKDIIGHEGIYTISTEGIVMNKITGKQLFGSIMKRDGYKRVTLTNSIGGQSMHKIHRLVATHFISNADGLEAVDHINENKVDNRVENLRWCTIGQNTQFYANHTNRITEGKKLYGPKEPKKTMYNTGKVYGTIANMVRATGKEILVEGVVFPSCGSAAKWIVSQETMLGNIRNQDTISKELRKFLQGRKRVWKMYDRYQIGN